MLDAIAKELKNRPAKDFAASRGEYLNGKVLANYLGFNFVDAAEVIIFDTNGILLLDETVKAIRERLKGLENAVIPGFYGRTTEGFIKTFSRGGSDVTGSIIANAVKADIYENWTDVSGFLVADPRIVDNLKWAKMSLNNIAGAGIFSADRAVTEYAENIWHLR